MPPLTLYSQLAPGSRLLNRTEPLVVMPSALLLPVSLASAKVPPAGAVAS